MSAQTPPPVQYDQIDLTWWLATLVRGRWLILAFIVAAVVAGVAASLTALPSTYQSAGVIRLPLRSDESGVGFTPGEYQQFAASDAVMQDVWQAAAYPESLESLRDSFDFTTEGDSLFFMVTASGRDISLTDRLADHWADAFGRHIQSEIQRRFELLHQQANVAVNTLLSRLTEFEITLNEFNQTDNRNVLEIELADLETNLAASSVQLHTLTQLSIPNYESRLVATRRNLTPRLEHAGIAAWLIQDGSALEIAEAIAVAQNTALLQNQTLTAQIAELQFDLVASEKRLRTLRSSIPNNEAKLASLTARLPDIPETVMGGIPEPSDPSSDTGDSADFAINPVYLQVARQIEDTHVALNTERSELGTAQASVVTYGNSLADIQTELISGEREYNRLNTLLLSVEEMVMVENELLTSQIDADVLQDDIALLETRIQEVRRSYLSLQLTGERLLRRYGPMTEELSAAEGEVNRLNTIGSQLGTLATVQVQVQPNEPDRDLVQPLAVTIGISSIAGLVIGVLIVILLDLYRAGGAYSNSARTERAEGA